VVTALSAGPCVVCLEPYAAGDEVGLLVDGWAHLDCFELTLATTAQLQVWTERGRRRG
jgi:hypothetical protein